MRHPHRLLLLTLTTLLLAACGKAELPPLPFSSDPLLGCYATGSRKPAEFRIERQGSDYYASFRHDGQWQKDPAPLHRASPAEIRAYFNQDSAQVQAGLVRAAGGFGLFHFAEGAQFRGKDNDSDYMAQVLLGVGTVYKRRCD